MLATVSLRVLLIRSQSCRNEFLKLLNNNSPIGLITSRSHFSCYTEYATNDESLGPGRLDMIIELDSVIIGFEIKLAAEFQPDQPKKYENELKTIAQGLGSIRRGALRSYVIVLAPESRRREVDRHLTDTQAFISWEEVLDAFKSIDNQDLFIKSLVFEFSDFLSDHLHFLPRFESWAPHLESNWRPRGNDEQRELLRKLTQLLPGVSSRAGSGDSWIGYYFQPEGFSERSWIGFIPTERIDGIGSKGACLVISRKTSVRDPGSFFHVKMDKPQWVDGQTVSTWRLKINPDWNEPTDWITVLAPFIKSPKEV